MNCARTALHRVLAPTKFATLARRVRFAPHDARWLPVSEAPESVAATETTKSMATALATAQRTLATAEGTLATAEGTLATTEGTLAVAEGTAGTGTATEGPAATPQPGRRRADNRRAGNEHGRRNHGRRRSCGNRSDCWRANG